MAKKAPKKDGRGGPRPGSGRPKSDIETSVIAVRLPAKTVRRFDSVLKKRGEKRAAVLLRAIEGYCG